MATAAEEDEQLERRRRPLVAGTGWLLFVCAFLPTLRVCSDPIAPYEFPPVYVVHLGAAVLAVIATIRALRTRRAWFTVWFLLWCATTITWSGLSLADVSPVASLVVIVGSIVGAVFAARTFHRSRFTPVGLWIGGIVHGALSTMWYALLSSDSGAVWGAFVGLGSSIALLVASGLALAHHVAELERLRRERWPSLPAARVVERRDR